MTCSTSEAMSSDIDTSSTTLLITTSAPVISFDVLPRVDDRSDPESFEGLVQG